METANDIYHHTRSSLMSIVSANVADTTLESVMDASGLTQETVNADHMMKLIRGPIYREFQTIVPKEGLKRQLTKLIGELQQVDGSQSSGDDVVSTYNGHNSGGARSARASKKAQSGEKTAPIRARIPGITTISRNAIGVPRAYFRDPRDDAFNIQMPLYGTDPHVVLDNGTRAVVRYWISDVALLDLSEIKKAGFRRYSFMVEEESHPNPTIVRLLKMLLEEEEAEQEALMLERLAVEAKVAAERDIAAKANPVVAQKAIQITHKDIEMLVKQYAELEEVRSIAMMRRDGEIVASKGRGLDINQVKEPMLESLNRLSLESFELQVARKSHKDEQLFSKCKSILIQHQSGVLYLLDYVDTIVMIYGTNDLNIGLMYSYAAAIGNEEDAIETSDEDLKEMA